MFRSPILTLSLLAITARVDAHFVFVVPDKGSQTAKVILSETLQSDPDVPVDMIGGSKLTLTDKSGHDSVLNLQKADHAYLVNITGDQPATIHGIDALGVTTRVGPKPCLLTYYPKTILVMRLIPLLNLEMPRQSNWFPRVSRES